MERKKVLIIDDDPLTCQLIGKMLKLHGFISIGLTDATLAIETIKLEKPHLILMDYHLGSSHGLEILSELRSDGVDSTIPVIMTSGMDRRKEALNAGAEDFLVKPFDWGTLAKTINRVLQSANHS
jgi:DNA-binding response OmpR family regulator